ncbi:MAG: CARDB domain-containing protein, partial [Bacteroidales bacterium]|nr:CARDB domain-containing protein [Bacteroidales bacterium]
MRKFTLLMLFATLATYSLHAQSNYLGVDNRDGVAPSNKKVFTEGLITKQNNTKSRLKVSGLFTETFSSGTLPAGWTNTDNTDNSAGTWAFDNPGGRGINTTTGASGFAIFDSDALGSDGLAEDADLISPAIDCSSLSTVILSFEHYYYGYSNSVAEVFVSGDNGATWTSLEAWGTTSTTNAALAKYDISSVAAGQSQVKIRWNFQGNWAWYWAIDDVIVGEPTIHDLAVQSINNSSALFTGVAPIVAIKNTGEFPEGAYSVTLSDGENYNETIDVTENVLLGNTYFVTFPNFTSLIEGENYTLTATLSCPDDTNPGNDELTTQVTASQNASDLGISSINVASELISGVVVSPTVTILNSGNSEVMVYSVFLTDGATYSETVNVTTAVAAGNEYDVTFPDWTPATGNYTLTARVTSAGDMNGHNNSLDKNVIASAGEHDLSVISVPNAVASGTTTAPYVNVLNIGNYSEASFSVSLSNGSDYNETVNVTTSIAVGESFKVTFPDWTPADGTYTLTATLTLTDDGNTDNNTLTQECKTVTERMAYVSRYNGASLNGTLNIPFDNFTEIGMSS